MFQRAKILFCNYLCWILKLAALLKIDSIIDVFVYRKLAVNEQMNRTWSWFIKVKNGTAPVLSIYFKLLPRRCRFSSWLSSDESSVKWSEHTWAALGRTGLAMSLSKHSLYLFSLGAVFCDRKYFCSILTDLNNLSNSK